METKNRSLTRAYLIKKLGERGMSRRRSVEVLNFLFEQIKQALARGEEVEFAGGRLIRRPRRSTISYLGEDWRAHWQYWTVEWVPRWEMLKQLLDPEEAQERRWFSSPTRPS